MRVILTRDSVAAGDDVDAPHEEAFSLPDGSPVAEVVARIAASGYLPRIGGGAATWSLVSRRPVAVLAQQWPEARMLRSFPFELDELNFGEATLRIHANYHAQQDPEIVFEVLSRMGGDGF